MPICPVFTSLVISVQSEHIFQHDKHICTFNLTILLTCCTTISRPLKPINKAEFTQWTMVDLDQSKLQGKQCRKITMVKTIFRQIQQSKSTADLNHSCRLQYTVCLFICTGQAARGCQFHGHCTPVVQSATDKIPMTGAILDQFLKTSQV